jgi:hypothetical protein
MQTIPLSAQLLSSTGALFILIAYVGHQMKWMDAKRWPYNVLNVVGAAILGYVALRPLQVGFEVMEVTWVGVSLWALWKALHKEPRPGE